MPLPIQHGKRHRFIGYRVGHQKLIEFFKVGIDKRLGIDAEMAPQADYRYLSKLSCWLGLDDNFCAKPCDARDEDAIMILNIALVATAGCINLV